MSCRGGYTHHAYDMTPALGDRAAPQEITMSVYDPTEDGEMNLMGKQRANVRVSISHAWLAWAAYSA